MIRVSVITTCYNSSATIRYTFESVLNQTYPNLEYIVKDGGSTDNTIEIIKEYSNKFKGRMKWVSEKDGGIYDGMNKGIKMSTGYIIGILNSDDFFTHKSVIENMIKAFQNQNIDAVYGDVHFVNGNNLNKVIRYYSSRLFKPMWLRFGFMPAHPSFYLKRDIYLKAGLYKTNYKISADFEMMVRLFYKYHISYYYLAQDFVTMRTGGVSTKSIKNRITILKEDLRACRENGVYTNIFLIGLKYLYKILEYKR